ncbi:hypothetical protein EW146_g3749 [Bondarzewia mesenterica]|uniref:Uncharacterized protein n=1 Tax=Bondarzewia mesenterica TaxID=1095465 RepID=A0A4S4LX60_9AGAM|nr:hypothetical protein EW146_g3749 [Bondarzewia mesenterica]
MSSNSSPTPTSSSSSFPSLFSDNPSQPTNTSQPQGGGGTSSSLYLFTFLATLFLLLFVSCAIVLRSFILRRRFQRRVEEAILAGLMPPQAPGQMGRKRDFGEKPRMWNAWISPLTNDRWENIMPVSVLPVSFKPSSRPLTKSTTSPGSPNEFGIQTPHSYSNDQTRDASRPPLVRRILRNPFRSSIPTDAASVIPLTPRSPAVSSPRPEELSQPQPETMQVTVLITMPSSRRSHAGSMKGKQRSLSSEEDGEDEDLPDIVLGVTQRSFRSEEYTKFS